MMGCLTWVAAYLGSQTGSWRLGIGAFVVFLGLMAHAQAYRVYEILICRDGTVEFHRLVASVTMEAGDIVSVRRDPMDDEGVVSSWTILVKDRQGRSVRIDDFDRAPEFAATLTVLNPQVVVSGDW